MVQRTGIDNQQIKTSCLSSIGQIMLELAAEYPEDMQAARKADIGNNAVTVMCGTCVSSYRDADGNLHTEKFRLFSRPTGCPGHPGRK